MFSCKRWTSTKFIRSEFTVETSGKYEKKSENNTKSPFTKQNRNVTSLFSVDLTFEWYEDTMVFRVFIVIIFV